MDGFFQKLGSSRKLGLRIIKTGIAATLSVAICSLLKLDDPYLAVIAAVLSMGRSIDLSVRAGRNKMIGVILGAALGCAGAAVLPGNAGLCGMGIILSLYLCQIMKLEGAGSLTCFTFAAVLFGASLSNPWLYALVGAGDALVGVTASVAVNLLVFPPNYAEEISRTATQLHEKTNLALEDAAAMHEVDTEELDALIRKLSGNVRLYVSETKLLRGDDEEVFNISCRVSAYRMILEELDALNSLELWKRTEVPENLQDVFDYHLDRARTLLAHVSSGSKKAGNKKKERPEE